MFRAMSLPGVPVACVSGSLETYGMLPGIQGEQRAKVLERFKNAYGPAIGLRSVLHYLGTTGIGSLARPGLPNHSPQTYSCNVTYPGTKAAQKFYEAAHRNL